MKNYKRIALLALIFIFSTVLSVYANTTAEVIVTPIAATAKVGDTVEVAIVAKCADGVDGFDGVLTWDSTKIELTNATELNESTGGLSDFFEGTKGQFLLTKMASSSTKDELNVATLKFKVLDAATVNEKLAIAISDIVVGDTDLDDMTIEITDAPDDGQDPDGGQDPEDAQDPDGGQDPEDSTIANKEMNKAGSETYAIIAILGMVLVAIVFYAKCKQYKDVK